MAKWRLTNNNNNNNLKLVQRLQLRHSGQERSEQLKSFLTLSSKTIFDDKVYKCLQQLLPPTPLSHNKEYKDLCYRSVSLIKFTIILMPMKWNRAQITPPQKSKSKTTTPSPVEDDESSSSSDSEITLSPTLPKDETRFCNFTVHLKGQYKTLYCFSFLEVKCRSFITILPIKVTFKMLCIYGLFSRNASC